MVRLIDADALDMFERLNSYYGDAWRDAQKEIDEAPTVDAKPVRHGRWIQDEFGTWCSVCGLYAYRDKFDQPWESPYCPNCGAKMDGAERKEE